MSICQQQEETRRKVFGHVTNLCNSKFMCQQRRNDIAIAVVSDDQIGLSLQFFGKFLCNILTNTRMVWFSI